MRTQASSFANSGAKGTWGGCPAITPRFCYSQLYGGDGFRARIDGAWAGLQENTVGIIRGSGCRKQPD